MEEMDILQRLSCYSSYITDEQEDYNIWITELAEATNCDNRSEFSVETFKKASEISFSKTFVFCVSDYQFSCKNVSRNQERSG